MPEHGVGGAGTLLEGGGKDVESISGAEGGGSYSGLPESAVKVLHDLGADEGGLAANRMPKMDGEGLCILLVCVYCVLSLVLRVDG